MTIQHSILFHAGFMNHGGRRLSTLPDESHDHDLTTALQQVRRGDAAAEARLLELCRSYIKVHAQRQFHNQLSPRVDASDVVQQAMMDAWRGLEGFRGSTSVELLAWLKQIVARNTIDVARQHAQAAKRCASREVPLTMPTSSSGGDRPLELASSEETPSMHAARCEEELMLANAIASLPADYQQVLICRSLLRLPFSEVAERMDRSRPAVQMLWSRAVEQLRNQLNVKDTCCVDAPAETAR